VSISTGRKCAAFGGIFFDYQADSRNWGPAEGPEASHKGRYQPAAPAWSDLIAFAQAAPGLSYPAICRSPSGASIRHMASASAPSISLPIAIEFNLVYSVEWLSQTNGRTERFSCPCHPLARWECHQPRGTPDSSHPFKPQDCCLDATGPEPETSE